MFSFQISIPVRNVYLCFDHVIPPTAHFDTPCCQKQIGAQTQHAVAMEASKRTGSPEIMLDSTRPKKPRHLSKKLHDQRRAKSQVNTVNIGDAFER